MENIQKRFQDLGLPNTKPDVTRGVILYNGLLWVEWLAVFSVCSQFAPIRRVAKRPIVKSFRSRLQGRPDGRYQRVESWAFRNAEKLARWRVFGKLESLLKTNREEFVYGLAETVIIYNCLMPLWLNVNMYLIYIDYNARKVF